MTNRLQVPIATGSDMSLGRQIKAARVNRGLSQLQLAEAIGVNVMTISRIERGGTPSINTCQKIANALGVTIVLELEPQ